MNLRSWLGLKKKKEPRKPKRPFRPDFSIFPPPSGDGGAPFDMITATDLRYPGGSSGSTLEEVRINHANGWRSGLYHLSSHAMTRHVLHEGLMQSIREGQCAAVNALDDRISTKVLLFRHPAVIHSVGDPLPRIDAEHVLLAVNHPPANAVGRIDYILPYAIKTLREAYGMKPKVFPVGPLIRADVNRFYDGAIEMEAEDWLDVFDVDRFCCDRRPPGRTIRVGRHSRPGMEKWPSDPETIRQAYPVDSGIEVHILGGAAVPEEILGYRPANWTVHEFGSMPVDKFLSGIDVFIYFHHPNWVEAFGRVIVEAMAAGLPVILPHHFRPLFRDAAIYCEPSEVVGQIAALRNADVYAAYSRRGPPFARENFGVDVHVARMRRFGLQPRAQAGNSACTASGAAARVIENDQ